MDSKKKVQSFFDVYVEDLKDSFNNVLREVTSPIEELFLGSLLSEAVSYFDAVSLQGKDDAADFGSGGPYTLRIIPQHSEGPYFVDFFISYFDSYTNVRKDIFVECDGHDFHEKTKEQAKHDKKRDRFLQHTAPVFRFTGSEIFNAAHECVDQVMGYLLKKN